jgi:hypothetical protein
MRALPLRESGGFLDSRSRERRIHESKNPAGAGFCENFLIKL